MMPHDTSSPAHTTQSRHWRKTILKMGFTLRSKTIKEEDESKNSHCETETNKECKPQNKRVINTA